MHTHALVFNATFAGEKWRSLASDTRMKTGFSENLYATKIALGNLYRSALREDIESMGFETVAAGKHGLWELKDVPVDVFLRAVRPSGRPPGRTLQLNLVMLLHSIPARLKPGPI